MQANRENDKWVDMFNIAYQITLLWVINPIT